MSIESSGEPLPLIVERVLFKLVEVELIESFVSSRVHKKAHAVFSVGVVFLSHRSFFPKHCLSTFEL